MMKLSLDRLFCLPRKYKRMIQLAADILLITASYLSAIALRVDDWALIADPRAWLVLAVTLPVSLMIFMRLGFYRAVIRYISHKAIKIILIGVTASAGVSAIVNLISGQPVPHSVPVIYAMLALLSIGGVRFFLRSLYLQSRIKHRARVVIYGAGAAGSQLVTSLKHSCEYVPIGFVDDWRGMHGTSVEGLKVYSPAELQRLIDDYGVQRILLAIPSAPRSRRRNILQSLEPLVIPVQTVPGMADVVAGRARINEIRDVAVEDLLGRDPVPPNQALMDANIRDKVVMVTGAGGSIGSELCRQIILQQPSQLLLLDVCEFSLYRIEHEIEQLARREGLTISVKALLGSVQHRPRLEILMRSFGVQTIYHAAAYKHVPMVEHNMVEGVRNNVFGTLETARAAIDCGVETFVLVSTDKAVRPTNVMGTTKRLAELICQALANQQQRTRFCMVRFGNVLGSSGSVVPLFRKQIGNGGPITVTHPDITRYFMTIPEAAQLVIQAGAMGRGGDVFVLDMGEPVKIAELAKQMVRLSGLEVMSPDNPNGDIEIAYSGLRPGEKLFEELLIGAETTRTAHPRIMTAHESYWEWARLEAYLKQLYTAVSSAEHELIRGLLQEAPTAYQPQGPIADLIWQQRSRPSEPRLTTPEAGSMSAPEPEQVDPFRVSVVALARGNNL